MVCMSGAGVNNDNRNYNCNGDINGNSLPKAPPPETIEQKKEKEITQALEELLKDAQVFLDDTINMEKHDESLINKLERKHYHVCTHYNKLYNSTEDYIEALKGITKIVKQILSEIDEPLKKLDMQLSAENQALITNFYNNAINLMLEKLQEEAAESKNSGDMILIFNERAKVIYELAEISRINLSNEQQRIITQGYETTISNSLDIALNRKISFGYLPKIAKCIEEIRGENITDEEQEKVTQIYSNYFDEILKNYDQPGYYELTLAESSFDVISDANKAKIKYNIILSEKQKEKVREIAEIAIKANKKAKANITELTKLVEEILGEKL